MILQLNPPIPMICPKGEGLALFMIDYGIEHNLCWVIAINETSEIWTYQNPDVRAAKNITFHRYGDKHEKRWNEKRNGTCQKDSTYAP